MLFRSLERDALVLPAYRAMAGREDESIAFQAARALVFDGVAQPSGYTEPLLHAARLREKARAG